MKTEAMANEVNLSIYYPDDIITRVVDSKIMTELAECFAVIFNESWGERWNTGKAVSFLRKSLRISSGRTPLLALLYCQKRIVGFSLIILTDCEHLVRHDMPIGIGRNKQDYALSVVKYWCRLAKKRELVIFRDLGILKEFRIGAGNQNFGSLLELTLIEEAVKRGYRTMFHWTSPQSAIFKVGISLGNHPICFFPQEKRIVLKGDAESICGYLRRVVAGDKKVYRELLANRRSYFCDKDRHAPDRLSPMAAEEGRDG